MVQENPYQSPLEECKPYDLCAINSPNRSLIWLYVSPDGRISRSVFWLAFLGWYLLGVISCFLIDRLPDSQFFLLFVPLMTFLCWCYFAIQVKRWHDRNKSMLWMVIHFIPVIGPIWTLIELGFFRGTQGQNRYGPDPTGSNLK
jgi:uncharacterized membrane protein YhaH (DUF805 family)